MYECSLGKCWHIVLEMCPLCFYTLIGAFLWCPHNSQSLVHSCLHQKLLSRCCNSAVNGRSELMDVGGVPPPIYIQISRFTAALRVWRYICIFCNYWPFGSHCLGWEKEWNSEHVQGQKPFMNCPVNNVGKIRYFHKNNSF